MKLTEFRELCEREWGEARGDVTGLSLTDESAEELWRDKLMQGFQDEEILLPSDQLFNPVTRTIVKITKGADEDTASVRRYYAEPHPSGA